MARRSLRTKWTLALLAAALLPLGGLAVATLAIQRRGLETAERQLEVAIIDHVSETVDGVLRDAAEATHRVGRLLTEARIADDDARLDLGREAMARATALAQVALYDGDGKLLDAIGRKGAAAEAPPATVPAVNLPANADGLWLPPSYGPGGARVRWLEPVVRDGQRRAWVLGTLEAGALGRRLEEISRDRFEDRADGVLLLDGDVRVLASGAGGALAVGQPLGGRDLFAATKLQADPFLQPLALATEFDAGGERMVGAVRSLPSRGWAVLVRRPAAAVFGALHAARRLLAGAAALLALLALLVGAWLASRTVEPVRALVALTRALGRREFDAAPAPIATGDELEELGQSMVTMAGDLKRTEAEVVRRAGVERDLSRYLPAEVAGAIADGSRSLALGGEKRAISVLFADVVSFTTFAEMAPPERTVALLNELFTVLSEVVFHHGGTVDKFIGDCVMAVFGAVSEQPDHAARALAAAEDMHRFVEASAPAWRVKYGVDVKLGIGVNSGEALVGNLGSERRMEYTAIGDTVNVAARLEALARPGQTLLTAAVRQAAGDAFASSSLGAHPLRGKQKPIEVFELA
jgi:class 3 adenylate cyclase